VIVQVAERRGIWATGYQFNQSILAPHGFLTGAEWAWGVVYRRYLEMIRDGKSVVNGSIPRRMTGTLKDEFCRLSPFGPRVPGEKRRIVAETKERLLNGSQAIYQGPLKDNTGRIAIPAGKTIGIEDTTLDQMDWLVEGVQGDTRG
jgi:basic membrane protein A